MHVDLELCASGVVGVGGAGCDFVVENAVAGVVAQVDETIYCFCAGWWGMVGRGFGDGGNGWGEGGVRGG